MLANNEVGTIQPIADVAEVVRAHGAACCSTWTRCRPRRGSTSTSTTLGADLVALAAHKAEGPKGIGRAVDPARARTSWPSSTAAAQERYRRAGTENVAGAVGMATAFELRAARARRRWSPRVRARRDRLGRVADRRSTASRPTGHPVERLPHIASVIVARGRRRLRSRVALDLEGIAASTGSACTSGSTEVSHVLTAMGYPAEEARGALRLSLGRTTTDAEIDEASAVVPAVIGAPAAAPPSRPRASRPRPTAGRGRAVGVG